MKTGSRPFCRTCGSVYVRRALAQIKDYSNGEWIYASDVLDDDEPVFTCVSCGSQDIGFEGE